MCVCGGGEGATKANLANDSKAAYNEIVRMILEDLRNCMEISAQNWLPLFLPLSLSLLFLSHSPLTLSSAPLSAYSLSFSVFSPFACFACTQEIAAYFLAHLKSHWQCRGGDGREAGSTSFGVIDFKMEF